MLEDQIKPEDPSVTVHYAHAADALASPYRPLRAVLTTAVEEDKILARNPCRIRGAGEERAPERPVLTVAQVIDLADQMGRLPVGK
jgi:hypothetical protein